jgi:integrase
MQTMSIHKRGKTYHLDIPLANGGRLRRSAETSDRKAAQELHDQLRAQLWRQEKLGSKQPRSLNEAAERWLAEHAKASALRDYTHHLAFWCARAEGMALTEITRSWAGEQIEQLVTRKGTPATPGTRNNYIITLRSVLNTACRDWEWIEQVPALRTYGDKRDGSRMVIATPAQAKALLEVLPAGLRAAVGFAFMTGLRKSNVFGLTWDRVDLARGLCWVQPIDTKAGNLIVCPLNSAAKALLEQQVRVDARVFPVEPICHHQWKRYTARAGLPDGFRFHDIRHTFASWLALDGTDRKTLQDLGGWKSPAMIDNYVHLPVDHLVSAAERLSSRLN